MSPSSRGSGTGLPESADHASATSATVRAIGPTVSSERQSENTPSVGIEPQLVLRPTIPQHAAGSRTEQPGVGPEAEIAHARGERGGVARRSSRRPCDPGARGS